MVSVSCCAQGQLVQKVAAVKADPNHHSWCHLAVAFDLQILAVEAKGDQ
jgi:hypothetical protein